MNKDFIRVVWHWKENCWRDASKAWLDRLVNSLKCHSCDSLWPKKRVLIMDLEEYASLYCLFKKVVINSGR